MGGGGMGGGMGGGGRGMGGGRSRLEDFVEGKLFLGGTDADLSREQLESYCSGWCVPWSLCCRGAVVSFAQAGAVARIGQ